MRIVGILFAMVLALSLVLLPATVLAPTTVLAQDQVSCDTAGCAPGGGTGGVANCEWDPYPKWWTNPASHDLYLNHWGRTPIQAMSRLAGLCAPSTLCEQVGTNCPGSPIYGDPNSCWPGGCPSCRDTEACCLACCSSGETCAECTVPGSCEIMGSGTCPVGGASPCACNDTPVFTNELPHCAGCWGVSLAFANKSWSAATIGPQASLNDNHLNHFGTSACYGGNTGGDWGLSGCPHTECCTLTWCLQDNCFTGNNCN